MVIKKGFALFSSAFVPAFFGVGYIFYPFIEGSQKPEIVIYPFLTIGFLWGIIFSVFYIWMIVHCIKSFSNPKFKKSKTALWLGVLWVLGPFLVYLYYMKVYAVEKGLI